MRPASRDASDEQRRAGLRANRRARSLRAEAVAHGWQIVPSRRGSRLWYVRAVTSSPPGVGGPVADPTGAGDVGADGMATDGLQFARAGARYTGVDFSPHVVSLASRRFELEGCQQHR